MTSTLSKDQPDDSTPRDALSPGSTADGSPTTSSGGVSPSGAPHARPSAPNPEALVEGNRVATAEDME